ncbi:hypothetical protein DENSPDRAFT_839580 [Dentipellis sp. KUC8613]|nr:hypothetical protein DENSPDRAFT_839580 [Dentipellis sp. KUC8613]
MSFRTVFGFWTKSTSASSLPTDIEAQPITGTYASFPEPPASHILSTPPRAFTTAPRATSPISDSKQEDFNNAIDDFFGASPSRRTRAQGTGDSRHDERPLPTTLPASKDTPPPYIYPSPSSPEQELPTYAQTVATPEICRDSLVDARKEPPTLAEYLFKYGFLFPLLWLLTIPILFTPLVAPEGWEPTKSAAERARILQEMRGVEVKWALRSLTAFLVFAVILATIVTLALVFKRA